MSKKILCFIYLIFIGSLNLEAIDKSEKPFVTCWLLGGQLGNQMHHIATTLAYAWDNNAEPYFPDLNDAENNRRINRDSIFFRLNTNPLPRPIKNTFTYWSNFVKKNIPVKPDLLLQGLFQNWEYYHHHRDKLVAIFTPKDEILNKLKSKYASLLNNPKTVAVHVRTFNKEWHNAIPFVGMDYYQRAFNLFPKDSLFVVFSDRINWCKHHFKKIDRSIIFIENQSYIEDFVLMSLLKHNIIANSSFSWWAAYLNQNPKKIVVAPDHFIHPRSKTKTNALLPEWIVLNINYNAPYPNDMKNYDKCSQSQDTQ